MLRGKAAFWKFQDLEDVSLGNPGGVEEVGLIFLLVDFKATSCKKYIQTIFYSSGFMHLGWAHQHVVIHELLVGLGIHSFS